VKPDFWNLDAKYSTSSSDSQEGSTTGSVQVSIDALEKDIGPPLLPTVDVRSILKKNLESMLAYSSSATLYSWFKIGSVTFADLHSKI